jgi:hypothetical protein
VVERHAWHCKASDRPIEVGSFSAERVRLAGIENDQDFGRTAKGLPPQDLPANAVATVPAKWLRSAPANAPRPIPGAGIDSIATMMQSVVHATRPFPAVYVAV